MASIEQLPHWCWLGLSLLCWPNESARADTHPNASGTAVIVASSNTDAESAQRAADHVEAALIARGVPVIAASELRARVERGSRAPAAADSSDLALLADEARMALEHVAFGRSAAAKRSVLAVFRRAERALESLNRETKTARHVLDACLALVRSAVTRGGRDEARREAMRCRRLVPDVTPSEYAHPPHILAILTEADTQLNDASSGLLRVESAPTSGCPTYINGRLLGVTPFRLERTVPGEYRVQVECEHKAGRVHTVTLGELPVDVLVDTELERALDSVDGDARVGLVYPDEHAAHLHAVSHAAALARSVGAERVMLVRDDGAALTLLHVHAADGALVGHARGAWSEDAGAARIDSMLDTLLAGPADTVPTPRVAPPLARVVPPPANAPGAEEHRAPAAPAPRRIRALRIASAALASVGLGVLGGGIALEHARQDAARAISTQAQSGSTDVLAELDARYDRLGALRWIGLAGGALLSAAAPLARIDVSAGVPWWSYAAGVFGAGLAGWGAYELVGHGQCARRSDDGACQELVDSAGRGGLLLAGAAPLLALPITHLIGHARARHDAPRHTSLGLVPRAGGALLAIHGEFSTW